MRAGSSHKRPQIHPIYVMAIFATLFFVDRLLIVPRTTLVVVVSHQYKETFEKLLRFCYLVVEIATARYCDGVWYIPVVIFVSFRLTRCCSCDVRHSRESNFAVSSDIVGDTFVIFRR